MPAVAAAAAAAASNAIAAATAAAGMGCWQLQQAAGWEAPAWHQLNEHMTQQQRLLLLLLLLLPVCVQQHQVYHIVTPGLYTAILLLLLLLNGISHPLLCPEQASSSSSSSSFWAVCRQQSEATRAGQQSIHSVSEAWQGEVGRNVPGPVKLGQLLRLQGTTSTVLLFLLFIWYSKVYVVLR
jgi:hypothetical protein